MAMLDAHGYRTVRLVEAVARMREGKPFPTRTCVLTFDDGYQTVYAEAFPVLQRYAMSATVFLTVGAGDVLRSGERLPTFEGRPMLSWPEIREMQQAGLDFGAHTLTHPDLTRLPAEQVAIEMSASKAALKASSEHR
jgi:peptidoglycan/xylan/chitin deacetylase (PgdA/CDA1 family)